MDLKQALEKIAELEGKVSTLEKENNDYKSGSEEFKKQMEEKEVELARMRDEARERGLQFKKFRDLTTEEKELLSEKEKELLQRQELQEEEFEKFKTEQENFKKGQREALIDSLIAKKSGGNKEIADQIKISLSKLKDIDTKMTEADLSPDIDFVYNGLGIKTSPDPLTQANNFGGSSGEYTKDGSFAETNEGQQLAGMLGLSQAQPDNNK